MAFQGDGSSGYVRCGDIDAIDGGTELTVCARIRVQDLTRDNFIAAKGVFSGDLSLFDFLFWRDETGAVSGRTDILTCQVSDGVDSAKIEGATGSLNDSDLHFVAFTFIAGDASGLRMYIDAVEDANSPVSTATVTPINTVPEHFEIGHQDDGTDTFFDGTIQDLRVYNRALSQAEIETIFAAEGHDGILHGLIGRWTFTEKSPGSAASTFVDSTTESAATTTMTLDVPTGVQDGDLLVAVAASEEIETLATPAGWTLQQSGDVGAGGDPSVFVFTREASSEPASYDFVFGAGGEKLGIMSAYTGVQTTPDVVSSLNTGTSATPTCPTVTPGGDALVIRVYVADDADQPGAGGYPDDTNGREAIQVGGLTPNGASLGLADQDLREGATGTALWTLDASEAWGGITMAFLGVDIPKNWANLANSDGEPVGGVTYAEDELSLHRRIG